ncbi:MAG: hypothetical protein CYPHOPRED_005330 [Cyphobasidiales sp. Tagirdzhanova-0007]|nr:MAG: hypothetical protein CYPHOPRED_005330 [Cyphobasidiales sp. Tagirdzhanova-0007]
MAISNSIFVREPSKRPSQASPLDGQVSVEMALQRFTSEQEVLRAQLTECLAFYKSLLDLRARKKAKSSHSKTLKQNIQVAEGFFLQTEVDIDDTDVLLVSLGLEDAYIELELEEAIAYAQRREQYLRV